MNKAGSFLISMIFIIFTLMAFSLVTVILLRVGIDMNETASRHGGEFAVAFSRGWGELQGGLQSWDLMTILLLLFSFVGVIVSAWNIRTHPVFFMTGFLSLAIAVFLAGLFTNVYEEVTNSTKLAIVRDTFTPLQAIIMGNLPIIVALLGFMVLVIGFSRGGGDDLLAGV